MMKKICLFALGLFAMTAHAQKDGGDYQASMTIEHLLCNYIMTY